MKVLSNLKHVLQKLSVINNFINCKKAGIVVGIIDFVMINIFKHARHYYPIPKGCIVQHPRRLYIGKNSIVMRIGQYVQAEGNIFVGNYVRIANFCTLMSTNHDLYDHAKKHPKPIIIHDYCWIGTHSIILAGVTLGPKTIVGAGSVVTKSFPEGYCVVAGNPAKVIRYLEREKVVLPHSEIEYYGCLSSDQFEKYRQKFIDVVSNDVEML